ncbi:MAG TPA: RidA family protein [Solirubrobacteraceae bacterium]|nr:RidA family protein [Solirubrobacteraceae bacterium]
MSEPAPPTGSGVEGAMSPPTESGVGPEPDRIVNPPELAPPTGFAHAVVAGTTIYLGGQTAHARDGSLQGETMAEQFDVAAGNLVTALRAAGGEPGDLVTLQVFVTDVEEYRASLSELGRVWRSHFGKRYPAMGLFGVTRLFDPGAKVELMGVAELGRA